jgi:hypothetical protein
VKVRISNQKKIKIQYTPQFQQVISMVYGIFYIIFFFTSSGYYAAISLRVWTKARISGETNNHKIVFFFENF